MIVWISHSVWRSAGRVARLRPVCSRSMITSDSSSPSAVASPGDQAQTNQLVHFRCGPTRSSLSSSAPRAEKLISLGLITGDTLELTEPYSACFPLLCYEESRLGNNFQNEAPEAVVNPCSLHDATHERAWRDEVIGFGAVTVSPNDQRGQQLRKEN